MTIADVDLRRAKRAARIAARAGLPITVCPWKSTTDNRERAMRGIWIRTFLRHRPELRAQVDYSG